MDVMRATDVTEVRFTRGEKQSLEELASQLDREPARLLRDADAWLTKRSAPHRKLRNDLTWWTESDRALHELLPDTRPIKTIAASGSLGDEWSKLVGRAFLSHSHGKVLHLVRRRDVLDDRLLISRVLGRGFGYQRGYAVGDSGLVLMSRRFGSQTLADLISRQDEGEPVGLEEKLVILRDVLRYLMTLHEHGFVHGDLRPENVSIADNGRADLVDWSLQAPYWQLNVEQRVYFEPTRNEGFDLREKAISLASAAAPKRALMFSVRRPADLYAYCKLAQRLLAADLWDDDHRMGHLSASAFAWVLQFTLVSDATVRPNAKELYSRLFERTRVTDDLLHRLRIRRNWRLPRELLRAESDDTVAATYEAAAERIGIAIRRYPETVLALRSASTYVKLVSRYAIDAMPAMRQNKKRKEALSRDTVVDQLQDPRPNLDAQWMDRLHRLHFGFGISARHDAEQPDIAPGSALELEKRRYEQDVANITRARTELLSRDHYLFSAGVVEILGRGSAGPPSVADISTLRRWGHILGVPDHGRWLYPAFQFNTDTYSVYPIVDEVNRFFEHADPWDILTWWHLPRTGPAEGKTFVDLIGDETYLRSELRRLS